MHSKVNRRLKGIWCIRLRGGGSVSKLLPDYTVSHIKR